MSDVEEPPEVGLYEIIFCIEGPNRDYVLYTSATDFDHSWFCSNIDLKEDLRLMTIEDLEALIESLQNRVNKMKVSK